jgi:hypothetical protein
VKRSELRAAFLRSGIKGRTRFVYLALLEHADNETCEIPDRYQPYGQHSESWWGVSESTVKRALPHLYDHGWLSILPWGDRPRKDPAKQSRTDKRRGRPRNWYGLCEGRPCDDGCKRRRSADPPETAIKGHPEQGIRGQVEPLTDPNKGSNCAELRFKSSEFQQVTPQIAMKGFREGEGMRGGVVPTVPYTGPKPLPDWEPGTNGWFMNQPHHEEYRRAS